VKRLFFAALFLYLLSGCGPKTYEAADLDQAGPSLRTALEAWKAGKSQEDLANQTPSILVNEDDWRTGKRLLDFTLDERGSLSGRQVIWHAQIKLQDNSGATEDRRATYVIDTTPRLVIVRDRFASR
jgi:hypothetical protein